MITNSHTKSHGLTTLEYKEKFGPDSMSCPEYREKRRLESTGSNNRMYGKTHSSEAKNKISDANKGPREKLKGQSKSEEHRRKISAAAKLRWKNSEFKELNSGRAMSEDTKNKISESLSGRKINPDVTKRAMATRMAKYIPGSRKGLFKHSIASREKAIAGLNAARNVRKEQSLKRRYELADKLNAELMSNVDSEFVRFKCSSCGNIFSRTPQFLTDGKFKVEACRVCYPKKKGVTQADLHKRIESILGRSLESNNREILGGRELDIYDSETKVAVEYCGLYWHSSKFNDDKDLHHRKYLDCLSLGIKLITVFEDEFLERPEVVVNRIAIAMQRKGERIFARKCKVVTLSPKEANDFLNTYHLQGSGRSNYRCGLEYEGRLISVMTFSNSNISRRVKEWEINRFATADNYVVVGGASKLFQRFVEEITPEKVISYSDNRWGNGNVYGNLGFVRVSDGSPNYWYVDGQTRVHRFSLRKNKVDDVNLTEWENRVNQGYWRIWDCGHTKWVWE